MKRTATYAALVLATAAAVTGLAVGTARADDPDGNAAADDPPHPHRNRMIERLKEQLGLTDEQVERAVEIRETFRSAVEPLREQLRQKKQEGIALFTGSSLSRSDLAAKEREILALVGQISEKRVDMIYALWQILTPEQRSGLVDILPGAGDDEESGGPGRGPGRHRGPRGFGF